MSFIKLNFVVIALKWKWKCIFFLLVVNSMSSFIWCNLCQSLQYSVIIQERIIKRIFVIKMCLVNTHHPQCLLRSMWVHIWCYLVSWMLCWIHLLYLWNHFTWICDSFHLGLSFWCFHFVSFPIISGRHKVELLNFFFCYFLLLIVDISFWWSYSRVTIKITFQS